MRMMILASIGRPQRERINATSTIILQFGSHPAATDGLVLFSAHPRFGRVSDKSLSGTLRSAARLRLLPSRSHA